LSLPTGTGPHEVAVSPDGSRAVVADYGDATPGTTLTVFDLASGTVANTLSLKELIRPHGVQFLPDGKRLAVTSESTRSLLVIDVDSGALVHRIPTRARTSHMVVITPDGRFAFVSNITSGSVSVVNLEEGAFIKEIPTGAGCEGMDISPDGTWLWTANRDANTLSVILVEAMRVAYEVECADFPIRLKFTTDGSQAWVTCAESSQVRIFDRDSRDEVGTIAIEADLADDAGDRLFGASMQDSPVPIGLLMHPDGKTAYVAAANADVVLAIDVATHKVTGGFSAGPEPDGLGFVNMSLDTKGNDDR